MSLVVGRERSRPVFEADPGQLTWRKYSKCSATTCVEVALLGDQVLVRDSKEADGAGSYLNFNATEWAAFLSSVRTEGCVPDLPARFEEHAQGYFLSQGEVVLSFDREEWQAFVLGVRAGEFDIGRFALAGSAP